MSAATRPKLSLHPTRCDGCGECVAACRKHAVRVGPSYILVDWDACDGCGKCVEFCERDAIRPNAFASADARSDTVERIEAQARAASAGAAAPGGGAVGGERWGLVEAAVVVVAVLSLRIALEAVSGLPVVRGLTSGGAMLARAAAQGVYYLAQAALLVYLALRRGRGVVAAFGLDRAPGWRAWPAALGVMLGAWSFALLYRAIALGAGWRPPGTEGPTLLTLFGTDAAGMALTVLSTGLVAPVVEELAFRGVALGSLLERWPVGISVVVAAVVFALLHGSAWQFAPMLVLGLGLGWLAARHRSLWPALAAHAGYNIVLVVVGLLAGARGVG